MSANQNEYKALLDLIKDLEEQSKTYEELLKSEIESLDYDTAIVKYINVSFSKDDEFDDENLKKIHEKFYKGEDTEFNPEDVKGIIRRVHEIADIRAEAAALRADANKAIEEYTNYITSPEYIEKKKKRLAELKEMAEKETNEVEKKKVQKLIDSMEATYTLSFLFTRFDKIGKDECESVIKTYFDNARSRYVIDRYISKCKGLGFNPDIYKYFFNIEEKFLDEKYHIFNNLFLYYAMRFIAYSDVNNQNEKMYCHALINNMTNLLYHKFPTQDDEDTFKALIMKVLDNFEYARDYFDKNNITHPKHPSRIERDKEQEKEFMEVLKFNITERCKELDVETPDTQGKTIEELRKILEDLDNEEEEQIKIMIPDIEVIHNENTEDVIDSEAVVTDVEETEEVEEADEVESTEESEPEDEVADEDNSDDGSPVTE